MKRLSLREAWPYLKDLQQDPLAVLLEWGRAHPRLFLPLPRFPLALIFDPEGVEGALLAEGTTKATFQYRALSRLTGRGLLTDWGKSWKEARKTLKDPFLPKSVRGYREAMEEEARAFFGEWRGEERDLDHEMLALSLRLLGRALFGEPLSPSLAEHALKALDRIMAQTRSPLALLDLAAEARFRKDRGALYREAEALIVHPPLSHLPRERALSEAVTLLVAGHETVASALTWSFLLLSHRPDWQKRVAESEEAALAAFQEALRLYPPRLDPHPEAGKAPPPGRGPAPPGRHPGPLPLRDPEAPLPRWGGLPARALPGGKGDPFRALLPLWPGAEALPGAGLRPPRGPHRPQGLLPPLPPRPPPLPPGPRPGHPEARRRASRAA